MRQTDPIHLPADAVAERHPRLSSLRRGLRLLTFTIAALACLPEALAQIQPPYPSASAATCLGCHYSGSWKKEKDDEDMVIKGLKANTAGELQSNAKDPFVNDAMGKLTTDQCEQLLTYFRRVRDGSPSAQQLSFPDTPINTSSAAQVLTISNARGEAATVQFTQVSGPFEVDTSSCALPGDGSCSVSVRFKPTAEGPANGSLRFKIDVNANGLVPEVQTISLQGNGSGAAPPNTPVLDIANPTLNFTQAAGASSPPQQAVIKNSGTGTLSLEALGLSGANADRFALDPSGSCVVGAALAAGQSCTVAVNFTPNAMGTFNAQIDIATNAGTPGKVALTGTGTSSPAGVLQGSGTQIAFSPQPPGVPSPPETLWLKNTGPGPLSLQALRLSGPQAGEFTLQPPVAQACSAGLSLAAGEVCSVNVVFTPATEGGRSAQLDVVSNAGNGNYVVSLSGPGAAQVPGALNLSRNSIAFGPRTLGEPGPAHPLVVTNPSAMPVTGLGAQISGAGFLLAPGGTCGAVLPAKAQCALLVNYLPSGAGPQQGELQIHSSVPGSPLRVALSGSGTTTEAIASLTWLRSAATPLSFSPTSVGTVSAPQTVALLNDGPGAVTLSAIQSSGAQAQDFLLDTLNCVGKSLNPGQTCEVLVRFAPSAAGRRQATAITVRANGGTTPDLFLEGLGLDGPAARLSLAPNTPSFERVSPGARTPAEVLVLSNDGASALNITGITTQGPFALRPGSCGAAPIVLLSKQTCTLPVVFAPQANGPAQGALVIDANTLQPRTTLPLSAQAGPDTAGGDDGGSGGCTMVNADPKRRDTFDPTLAALVVAAITVMWRRRR